MENIDNALEPIETVIRKQEILAETVFLGNMAVAYSKLDGEDALHTALITYNKAIQLLEKNSLANHLYIAKFANEIGGIYVKMGGKQNLELALLHYYKALRITKLAVVEKSRDITNILDDVAKVHSRLGGEQNLYAALNCYEEALTVMSKQYLLGEGQEMISFWHNSSILHCSLGRKDNLEQALLYQKKILTIQNQVTPELNLVTAETIENIGIIYHKLGDNNDLLMSISYQEKSLEIKKNLSTNPIKIIGSLNKLAMTHTKFNNKEYLKQALAYYQEALEMEKQVFPAQHPYIANSLNNIGNVLSYLGGNENFRLALHYYHEALSIKRQVLAEQHPGLASSLSNIGFIYHKLGEINSGYEYLGKSYLLVKSFNHSNLLVIFTHLQQVDINFTNLTNWLDRELEQKPHYEINCQRFLSNILLQPNSNYSNLETEFANFLQLLDEELVVNCLGESSNQIFSEFSNV